MRSADLNRDLLDGNDNPNLRTLIPHVPTLGTTAEDVPEAAALITGGNTTHYCEETGIVGKLYEKTLGIDGIYAWDVWMVYKPGRSLGGHVSLEVRLCDAPIAFKQGQRCLALPGQ